MIVRGIYVLPALSSFSHKVCHPLGLVTVTEDEQWTRGNQKFA